MSDLRTSDVELVDAHCHVDLFPDPGALLRVVDERKVHTIAVTNAPSVFGFTERLAAKSEYMHAAVGLHPELVATHGHELERMWPLLERTRFVGEIGLDYGTGDQQLRARQRAVFSSILEKCAASGDKVLTVHSRRSTGDVLAAIGKGYPGRVILHWFSGSMRDLNLAIQQGLYFSVNPAMLQSRKGRDLILAMPRDRILTESDGPFVQTDGAPASPKNASTAVRALAELWDASADETARALRRNYDIALIPLVR